MKSKVNFYKDGRDYIAYIENGSECIISASIIAINEYSLYGSRTQKYRVDFRSRTIGSLLTLTEAKKIATKKLKEELKLRTA